MTTNTACKLAVALRRRYNLPGPAVAAIRRCLLTLGDDWAVEALAQVEARGDVAPLFAAARQAQRRRKFRTRAEFGSARKMGRAAAEALANDFGAVLGLSFPERRRVRELARRLGEAPIRDALADAWEEGSDPLRAIDRLAA